MLGLIALTLFSPGTTELPLLSVAPVRWDISDDAVVGRKKSGLLCGPDGRLRWKDVKPDRTIAAERIATALMRLNVPVRGKSDNWAAARPKPTRYRLFARIAAIDLSLCNRQWRGVGLVADASLKGIIKFDIEWRLYDDIGDTLLLQRVVQSDTRLDRKAVSTDDAVYLALAENAQQVSRLLASIPLAPLTSR